MNKLTKISITTAALVAACISNAGAYETTPTVPAESKAKSSTKNTAKPAAPKKASTNKKNTALASNAEYNEAEPSVTDHSNTEYSCELGNSIVMYSHPSETDSVAMRWKKRLYKLMRVETSTGANRFENTKAGLVWIDIPTKGMLLDSHRGQQLANECKAIKVAADSSQQTMVK
jgi:hypothetical protein